MFNATKRPDGPMEEVDSIIEHVYGIIDSKFQFIKHRTNRLIETQMDNQSIQIPDLIDGEDLMQRLGKIGHDASILQHIEEYSKTTRMLLFLRNYLCNANSRIILDLLTDDIYLNFNERELKIVIDGQKQQLANA
ncbi:MAG: hypothetical protein AAFO94_17975 [Bacteroidota bacterium]